MIKKMGLLGLILMLMALSAVNASVRPADNEIPSPQTEDSKKPVMKMRTLETDKTLPLRREDSEQSSENGSEDTVQFMMGNVRIQAGPLPKNGGGNGCRRPLGSGNS